MAEVASKLDLEGDRIVLDADLVVDQLQRILQLSGCGADTAASVAAHLVDASLCGVESHGVMRVLQYVEQFEAGEVDPGATPRLASCDAGFQEVDGRSGIGIPAMALATRTLIEAVGESGMAVLPIRHVGHTGRLGAFAEKAAEQGLLVILLGGGNRGRWPQVAPHGGTQGRLPTNPWCIGIPGGERGPVVLDFATSRIAGGWIYAAHSAGARLPEDCVIDRQGQPTTDPEDYFDGGAILPAGGAKGYSLALVAELVAEAMLGPATTECNWIMIGIDTGRYRSQDRMRGIAEEILAEIRSCPPAPGFDRVEIPGERERDQRRVSAGRVCVPRRTWVQVEALARRLGGRA